MFNISEQFVLKYIIDNEGLRELPEAAYLITKYMEENSYPSKNKRLKEWRLSFPEPFKLIISIFTIILINKTITYQAIIGKLNHKIKVKDSLDRFKILADIIGLISNTGLIVINYPGHGQYINITTDYEIADIPEKEKHIITINRPQPIETNWDPEHHSMLLGHPMNHHNYEICLNHLNELNQIPLKLNKTFVNQYKEQPKNIPKTQKAQNQWDQFMEESFHKYKELLSNNQIFYLIHKYDTRGRTYACGYHVTSQGSNYKKAIIKLANKELVER